MAPPIRRNKKKGKPKSKSASKAGEQPGDEPNAEIIIPKTKEEKELEKRLKLRQQVVAESETGWSSKKKKRLDKYIDKKLEKEERGEILQKLAQSQAEVTTSLDLQSSSTLGTGRVSSIRQLHEGQEDRHVRRALQGNTTGKRRRPGVDDFTIHEGGDSSDEDVEMSSAPGLTATDPINLTEVDPTQTASQANEASVHYAPIELAAKPAAIGSALKRNADGSVIAPKMRVKTNKKTRFGAWKRGAPIEEEKVDEEDSDTSFDSSDSDIDTGDDSDEEEHSDDESTSGSEMEESPQTQAEKPKRNFKEWATKQLLASQGHDTEAPVKPEIVENPRPAKKQKVAYQPGEMRGPLGEKFELPRSSLLEKHTTSDGSKVKFVSVQRPADVEEARILLPIVTEEQPIMEAVLLHPVVIICGETGSGKTTQVPQFLFEAGFGHPDSDNPGMIGITQPRRVAAISMATRVAHELSLTTSRVSYQIRYDATVSPSTSIKFMTDGVLLRELATDFLLTKYSVIIIDEAHERSMNTDILIGVLSRVSKLRQEMWRSKQDKVKPLRLIIMSATLRVSDFADNTALFDTPPPIINVAARQHPVTVHFNRRTPADYVTEAVKKASKIHARLPPGGILIFLTGQNEITGVCRKLETQYGVKALEQKRRKRAGGLSRARDNDDEKQPARQPVDSRHADVEAEDLDLGADDVALDVDGDDPSAEEDPEALDSDDDEIDQELGIQVDEDVDTPMHILPLYSLLPSEKQLLVFKEPPEGSRLVVVSTNVAETSLTIPGIRYVVDGGRAKERRYDVDSGIQSFQVSWVSKASSSQRAGRAGRTGPGHCYRLYSSALYEHYFEKFSCPEILRMPIEGVVLQMKSMHLDSVMKFPFPTPPERTSLRKAEKTLTNLGALKPENSFKSSEPAITDLGRSMSLFPLSPRFSRMLVSGQQRGCLPYVITLVSALSVGDPFLREETIGDNDNGDSDVEEASTSGTREQQELRRRTRKEFFKMLHIHASLGNYSSDDLRLLSVVGAYEFAGGGHQFCATHFVRPKAMEEIHKLRAQISNIVQANFTGMDALFSANLTPPTEIQLKIIRQLLCAGFIDQVAIRKDRIDALSSERGTKYSTSKGVAYRAAGVDEDVFIHPSSILFGHAAPEFVVYREIMRTSRPWMKGLTVINPAWLATIGKDTLCTFSKPTINDKGVAMVIPRFGPEGWELPPIRADTIQ
ncbi:P-loop containing nucleoside triphosphate hydrolase protein [Pterulicium gracile]|uniref:RNA helicase n=1 Tax=Pterulicium gracile TaxID=1884261 RepID=A0A5C3QMW1_9AGAR|nr:P-loop containing nucleoside triphosphate hydrolase protein [Pterula gracilis]